MIDRQTPYTYEEWVALLHKQEKLHNSEIQHWQEVLKKGVLLLKEVSLKLTY